MEFTNILANISTRLNSPIIPKDVIKKFAKILKNLRNLRAKKEATFGNNYDVTTITSSFLTAMFDALDELYTNLKIFALLCP
jgi:hypothetical protein